MSNGLVIYRGSRPSGGAVILRDALREAGVDVILNATNSGRNYWRRRTILNWGCTSDVSGAAVINNPYNVQAASNKLEALRIVDKLPWTIDKEEVAEWLEDGYIAIARTLIRASSGRGIIVVRPGDEIPDAPLYTRYIKKQYEYRVHVFNGETILIQQKRKRNNEEQDRDQRLIRSHDNGWVFAVNDVVFPNEQAKLDAEVAARVAVDLLGLQFGAVDVVLDLHTNKPYVLEVNTAPGLDGDSTIEAYTNAIKEYLTDDSDNSD